jgi:hypothetical protein
VKVDGVSAVGTKPKEKHKMTKQQKLELQQLSNEMRDMYEKLKKAHRQGKRTRKLDTAAGDLMCDFETYFGVPAFRPEVPAETVKMFFTLRKLVGVCDPSSL